MISRRGLIGALIAAPAVVRASSLMPVKPFDDNLLLKSYERYLVGWEDWRGVPGSIDPGSMRALLLPGIKRIIVSHDEIPKQWEKAFAERTVTNLAEASRSVREDEAFVRRFDLLRA